MARVNTQNMFETGNKLAREMSGSKDIASATGITPEKTNAMAHFIENMQKHNTGLKNVALEQVLTAANNKSGLKTVNPITVMKSYAARMRRSDDQNEDDSNHDSNYDYQSDVDAMLNPTTGLPMFTNMYNNMFETGNLYSDIDMSASATIAQIDRNFMEQMDSALNRMVVEDGMTMDEARDKLTTMLFGEHGDDGVFAEHGLLEPGDTLQEQVQATADRYLSYPVIVGGDGTVKPMSTYDQAMMAYAVAQDGAGVLNGHNPVQVVEYLSNTLMGNVGNEADLIAASDWNTIFEFYNSANLEPSEFKTNISNAFNTNYQSIVSAENGGTYLIDQTDIYAAQMLTSENSPVTELYNMFVNDLGDDVDTKRFIAQAFSNKIGVHFGIDADGNLCPWTMSIDVPAEVREQAAMIENMNSMTLPNPGEAYDMYSTLLDQGLDKTSAMSMMAGTLTTATVANTPSNELQSQAQAQLGEDRIFDAIYMLHDYLQDKPEMVTGISAFVSTLAAYAGINVSTEQVNEVATNVIENMPEREELEDMIETAQDAAQTAYHEALEQNGREPYADSGMLFDNTSDAMAVVPGTTLGMSSTTLYGTDNVFTHKPDEDNQADRSASQIPEAVSEDYVESEGTQAGFDLGE